MLYDFLLSQIICLNRNLTFLGRFGPFFLHRNIIFKNTPNQTYQWNSWIFSSTAEPRGWRSWRKRWVVVDFPAKPTNGQGQVSRPGQCPQVTVSTVPPTQFEFQFSRSALALALARAVVFIYILHLLTLLTSTKIY